MSEIAHESNERQNVETLQSSGVETSRSSKVATSKSSKSVLLRKDGRRLKRMTLYLPADLARQLAHHCVDRDSDASAIAALAITHYLTFSK